MFNIWRNVLNYQIFEAGVSTDLPVNETSTNWAVDRKYLLHPVEGILRYHRRGKRENREPHVPFQKLSIRLDQLSVTVSEVMKSPSTASTFLDVMYNEADLAPPK